MSPVRILVMYNGDWIFSENGFEFNGDELKGIIVDEKITYSDLSDKVYVEFFVGENLVDDRVSEIPPFLALTEIEEQNTTAISCGPQADLNCDDEMQNVDQHQHDDCNDDRGHDNEVENKHMQDDTYGCSDEIHPHTSNDMYFDSLTIQNGRKDVQEYVTCDPLNSSIQPCLYSEQLNTDVPKNLTVEQLMSDDTIAVGQTYPSKQDVQSKLSLMAIRENFEFKMNDSDCFLIRKFHIVHTCLTEKVHCNHHQASSWVVGQLIKSKFEEGASDYRPNDIIKDVEEQLGVTISYDKAWRTREIAFRYLKRSRD
ncbi:hypothetical protein SDJN02_04192, partial [Cucurbita argyrosperma subsp. argyrosperma]